MAGAWRSSLQEGEEVRSIPVPLPMVTSVCFGGPDLRDLYIVTGSRGGPHENCGAVFRIRADTPGLPLADLQGKAAGRAPRLSSAATYASMSAIDLRRRHVYLSSPRRKLCLPSFRGPRSGAGLRAFGEPCLTHFAYLDEFGHVGPYLSRMDRTHNDSPVFGLAGFVLPSQEIRDSGRGSSKENANFLSLK